MSNSKFLVSLIYATINTTGSHKGNNKLSEKAYYCGDCGGDSLSLNEKETEHKGHTVIRAIKNSNNHYSYRKVDILGLKNKIDVSGICSYKINSTTEVYFLRTRAKDNNGGKQGHYCCNCGWSLNPQQQEALYCSLLCKLLESSSSVSLSSKKKKKQQHNNGEEKREREISNGCGNTSKSEGLVEVAEGVMKERVSYRNKNNTRKGIPQRSPLF